METEKRLHLLDSFDARGTDGASYKVMAYEHLQRVDLLTAGLDQWEPTGLTEYRLTSGERIDIGRDGALRVAGTGVGLRAA